MTRPRLLGLAPALTLTLFLAPIAAGLIGTWLPAFGFLPALGGDEFGVLALEATRASSELLIQRLRESVIEFNQTSSEPYQLSVSIGMSRHEDGLRIRLDELVSEADNAMYAEKHSKRSAMLRQS